MLHNDYLSVLEVKTRDELQKEVVRFARQLGFQTVAAMAVIDHFLGEPEFISVDNTPAAYLETFGDVKAGKHDPVMQHAKKKSVPLMWDQTTYLKANMGDRWEHQASFGYCCGIILALHMPEGRHFVLGVDRDQALPNDPAEVTRTVAALQLFAVQAQEVAMRILVPPAADAESPALTPRELEALRWTMAGKTAWEIGRILGISENTVVRHVHSATRKLDCANKLQAVLKALRLRLIS